VGIKKGLPLHSRFNNGSSEENNRVRKFFLKKVGGNKKSITFALPFEQRIEQRKNIGKKNFFKKKLVGIKKVVLLHSRLNNGPIKEKLTG